jgi:predicted AlkP superfamily pyrophosphatase or phosphodiesterase
MQVDLPTVSGPSWTTLLTGTVQEIHKVIDNEFISHNLSQAPDLLSRAKVQRPDITTYAAAGWPPLIDPNDVGPVIAARPSDQSAGSHTIFIRDGETHGYEKIDREVAEDAVRHLQANGPHLSCVYFCGADEAGHLHGTIAGPYFDAIRRIDSYVDELRKVVRLRHEKFNEPWIIAITTDHGHRDEGGHGGDSPQERASFILAEGIGTEHPQWSSRIKPEDVVKHILATL